MAFAVARPSRPGVEVWVLVTLVGLHADDAVRRLRGPPTLAPGPSQAPRVGLVPIEHRGEGVACAPPLMAALCPRIGVARRLVIGAAIDLARAGAGDLEALPGIGPVLAQRILSARPVADEAALGRVRGLGRARAHALSGPLGLDGRQDHDICSLNSWPTTSSGCGKPR